MYGIGTGRIGWRIATLGLVAALGGCALSERAETLYLRQHKAATALAETIAQNETRNPLLVETLYVAEAELDQACAPLRHAGYLRFQAETIEPELEWEIISSLEGCALKTEEMEGLVWRINPSIAAYFLPIPAAPTEHSPLLSLSAR
ncbi:MAG: hypothetical protein ACTSW2_00455 [Alphaproteobacteria bacterium]